MSRDIQDRLAVVASELNSVTASKSSLLKRLGDAYRGGRKSKLLDGKSFRILDSKDAKLLRALNKKGTKKARTVLEKAAANVGRNRRAYLIGTGTAGGLAAGGYGVNKLSAMEYFENITAAEYLEDITGGNLGFSVSASDYSDLMNISAMEYIIAEDDVASELTDLSADAAADVTDAETPEEFAEAVQNNQELADAHADAAEINADTAAREDSPEAAALAEYHAELADEHEDLANDVVSALYYE